MKFVMKLKEWMECLIGNTLAHVLRFNGYESVNFNLVFIFLLIPQKSFKQGKGKNEKT